MRYKKKLFLTQISNDFSHFSLYDCAMGGTFGGDIDSAFLSETMEIDFVRIYQ